jgi:hypothetical protein
MHRRLPRAAVLVLAFSALAPAGVLAASPPPAQDPFPAVETWIDAPPEVPPDAPAGAPVAVGFTLWDIRNRDLFSVNGLVAKLYPAKGKAAPSVAKAVADAPGHLLANLTVPTGGAGRIEIVTQGQQCTAGGACATIDIPLRINGTGPPPDAPRSKLVRAQLLPVVGDVVAGRPAPIAVLLSPIGLWDPAALDLPSAIQVVITRVGGGRLGSAELDQIAPDVSQPYQGGIRVPETGEMTLTAALVGPNGQTDPIDGELGRVLVVAGGGRPDASPGAIDRPSPGATAAPAIPGVPAAAGADGGPPILLLGAIGVLVLGLLLFLGEPLTRRLRGRKDEDARP